MSHSTGIVRFADGTLRYFEYNGTVGAAIPMLYRTPEELEKHWRSREWHGHSQRCSAVEEPVEAFTFYGDGIIWETTACLLCGVLTGKLEPLLSVDDKNPTQPWKDGHPAWCPCGCQAE